MQFSASRGSLVDWSDSLILQNSLLFGSNYSWITSSDQINPSKFILVVVLQRTAHRLRFFLLRFLAVLEPIVPQTSISTIFHSWLRSFPSSISREALFPTNRSVCVFFTASLLILSSINLWIIISRQMQFMSYIYDVILKRLKRQ